MTLKQILKIVTGRRLADLPKVQSVERLEINPETVLVITIDDHISAENAARIRDTIAAPFPGVKVMILDGGMKLSTIETKSTNGPDPWNHKNLQGSNSTVID